MACPRTGIQRLPIPILEHIFGYTLDHVEINMNCWSTEEAISCEYTIRRAKLASICRDWRITLMSGKRFWSTVVVPVHIPPKILKEWLTYSGDLPLQVYVLGVLREDGFEENIMAIWKLLNKEKARITDLVELRWENHRITRHHNRPIGHPGYIERSTLILRGASEFHFHMERHCLSKIIRETSPVAFLTVTRKVILQYFTPSLNTFEVSKTRILSGWRDRSTSEQKDKGLTKLYSGKLTKWSSYRKGNGPKIIEVSTPNGHTWTDRALDIELPPLEDNISAMEKSSYDGETLGVILAAHSTSLEGLTISNMHVASIEPHTLGNINALTLASCRLGNNFFRSFLPTSSSAQILCPCLSVLTVCACTFDTEDFVTFIRSRCIPDSKYHEYFEVMPIIASVIVITKRGKMSEKEMKRLRYIESDYTNTLSVRTL